MRNGWFSKTSEIINIAKPSDEIGQRMLNATINRVGETEHYHLEVAKALTHKYGFSLSSEGVERKLDNVRDSEPGLRFLDLTNCLYELKENYNVSLDSVPNPESICSKIDEGFLNIAYSNIKNHILLRKMNFPDLFKNHSDAKEILRELLNGDRLYQGHLYATMTGVNPDFNQEQIAELKERFANYGNRFTAGESGDFLRKINSWGK